MKSHGHRNVKFINISCLNNNIMVNDSFSKYIIILCGFRFFGTFCENVLPSNSLSGITRHHRSDYQLIYDLSRDVYDC